MACKSQGEDTVLMKEEQLMSSLQGREQAFWKVLATPGHAAEQLLVASLGLYIVSDVPVCMSTVWPTGSVPKAGLYSWVAY